MFMPAVEDSLWDWLMWYELIFNFRPWLEAPLLQQAAFDELVYEVDVMRNVAIRRTQTEKEEAEHERERERRPSLPVSYNTLQLQDIRA